MATTLARVLVGPVKYGTARTFNAGRFLPLIIDSSVGVSLRPFSYSATDPEKTFPVAPKFVTCSAWIQEEDTSWLARRPPYTDGLSWAALDVLWRRPEPEDLLEEHLSPGTTGVALVHHGQHPSPEPQRTVRGLLGIDTGVHFDAHGYGHLTIAEIQTGEPKLHRFPRTTSLRTPRAEPVRS